MEIFLVGGAIRDRLLQRDVLDRDFVVVGATPEQMLDLGFRPVGRDFPVFLHPKTHEEYALARTERKTGPGYHGFHCNSSPDVTLEEDLARRDLTINAMAETRGGQLVDPYGGQQDLQHRILRHVSPAFAEDPVRLLRVARFAAQLASEGFSIAPETLEMMRDLVQKKEIHALVAERVWVETDKALTSTAPVRFFEVLRTTGALAVLFPEVERLFGVPQPPRHHPEIDTGVHTFMVLEQATRLSCKPEVRFAALVHDLGKGSTPKDILPSHHGHEQRSVDLIEQLCKRLRVPKRYRDLAIVVAREHGLLHRIAELRTETLLSLLHRMDAFRRRDRVEDILLAIEADSRGRKGLEDRPYPQAETLRTALRAAASVTADALLEEGFSGPQLGQEIKKRQLAAIHAQRGSEDP